MSLITKAIIREHFDTDLVDDAVQRLIDEAEALVDKSYGQLATQTDELRECSLSTVLFLSRRAISITTITEEVQGTEGDYTATVLASDDFQTRYEGRQIERLSGGTNSRATWGDIVTVVYVPEDEMAARTGVIIDLVKLSAQYNAMHSEEIGDYRGTSLDYEKERKAILQRLARFPFA